MDEQIEKIKKLRDPKFYLENFCKIKRKSPPGLIQFILNEAQKDFCNAIKTFNRIIILKARQIGFCLSPETRILTADFKWIKLDDINVGQEIIAVDEHVLGGRGSSRKMRKAIVKDKFDVFEEAYKITMDNGSILIATNPHKFLFKYRGAVHTIWRKVSDARIGDEIRLLTNTWDNNSTYEDGWFGGMIDGEGSLCKKNRTGSLLNISQIAGPVLNRLLLYVNNNKINFRIEIDKRKPEPGKISKFGSKDVYKIVIGQMGEIFKILGKCRPTRMLNRDWWTGKKFPGNGNSWVKIVSIEPIGKQRMIDLQTSRHTYIAEGFVSHNSTLVTGYFYHNTIMNPGTTTALIGYNTDMTAELLDKVKVFYKTTPPDLRPTIHYNSKYEISFPRIDSKIVVLPSTESVGRSYTLTNCLITELSSWDKPEEKIATIEAAVPIDGRIVIESTPRGTMNLYHRMFMNAKDIEDNPSITEYIRKEYGWWWLYSKEEIEIIRRRMNDERLFAQEYGLEFLTSGRAVFDQKIISECRKNILKIGESYDGHFVKEENELTIYKEPEKDGLYVAGIDTSEGVSGGDYSVAVIINRKTGEEVAFYRGMIAPDKLASRLNQWGRKYNNALMVIEVNNNGLTTVINLRDLLYPSLYFRPAKFETISSHITDRIGWRTNKVTRYLLIDDLAKAMREKSLLIHSKAILDEMMTFIYDDNNKMVAQQGYHDDCIFATGVCYQGFKVLYDKPLDQLNYNDYLPKSFIY